MCTIRKPVVWHRDEPPSASLKGHLDECHVNLWRSYYDDSGSGMSDDDSDISADDERPGKNSDSLQSQHSRSRLNVLDLVDDGSSGDVTRPKGFDTDYAR